MKKNLAILLEFGFHEVKKYIHSGLAQKLNEQFNIYWVALEKDKQVLKEQFGQVGEKIIYVQECQIVKKSSKLEIYNRVVRESWMRRHKIPLFHNIASRPKYKNYDILLGWTFIKKIFQLLVIKQVRSYYQNNALKELLIEFKINKVLGVSCNSVFAKSVFSTAIQQGIEAYYLVNSWKDLYTNDFVPIKGFKKIMVWSEGMKKAYLKHCSYLIENQIVISGNPSFDVYANYKPYKEKSFYAERYNIDTSKSWIYYTMMPPGIWPDEIHHVIALCNALLEHKVQVKLLLRRNPNHQRDDFTNLRIPENCILTQHHITFDKQKDLIIQTLEGEQEWMDLVYYSSANISIPSTVTLEFMALGKPVINPAFSMAGEFPKELLLHFESGFYASLFTDEQGVMKINDLASLISFLKRMHVKKSQSFPALLASNIIVKTIE